MKFEGAEDDASRKLSDYQSLLKQAQDGKSGLDQSALDRVAKLSKEATGHVHDLK